MVWRPRVTVAAVAEREGRFLLVEETSHGRLVLNQPAGHLEEGESLYQAVVREVLEETGWDFRPQALVGIYRWQRPGNGDTFLRMTFCGELTAHNPARPLDSDIERTVWLDPRALAEQHQRLRSPMVLQSVEDYLAGRRYPLDLFQDL